MNAILNNLLYYVGLYQPPPPASNTEENVGKYKSITKYTDLHHPYKDLGYVSTFKTKNYHYHFDQSISQIVK